jgi:hypothetical protein
MVKRHRYNTVNVQYSNLKKETARYTENHNPSTSHAILHYVLYYILSKDVQIKVICRSIIGNKSMDSMMSYS